MPAGYSDHVFLNCPFDERYAPMFRALVFTIHDAGFVPRCALEVSDAAQNRYQKILDIVSECRFGIHDISRTEPGKYGLPRFNMPFELGVFLGCKAFGGPVHRQKVCLVLDRRPYRYQRFLSDIAGQDVASHDGKIGVAIRAVRDWLRTASKRSIMPGGTTIANRYDRFRRELPAVAARIPAKVDELTFLDYTHVVLQWLEVNARPAQAARL